MSKRANPALIGGFVVIALALLVAGVVYFGSGKLFADLYRHIIYFQGNAAGLQVGAPVVLKGVRIGEVTNIQVGFYPEQGEFVVPVIVELDGDRVIWPEDFTRYDEDEFDEWLIEQGLRARLSLQSIVTGQLMIELGFFPGTPAQLFDRKHKYFEIPAIPSDLEEISRTLKDIPWKKLSTNFAQTLEGLNSIVNSPKIPEILDDVQQAAAEIRTLARTLNQQIGPLGTKFGDTAISIQELASLAKERTEILSTKLIGTTKNADKLMRDLDVALVPAISSIRQAAVSAEAAFDTANNSFASVHSLVGESSPLKYEVLRLLTNLSDMARSLRDMADYLERHPEAILQGKR